MPTSRLLVLVLLMVALPVIAAAAKTYSCRDNQGGLHLADSLENLPEACRAQAQLLEPGAVDNLNFVPLPVVPSGSGIGFEQSVRDVERELQQKKQLGNQLQQRADQLAAKYATASVEKHRARRNWKYSSRATIKAADESIQQVWVEKQQLLQELAAASLASEKEQQIRAALDSIVEE
jgi:hypothetical protein